MCAGRPVPSLSSDRSSHVLSSAGYESAHTATYSPGRKPPYPVLVVKQVHVERSEQRCSEVLEVEPYPRTLKWTHVRFCSVVDCITLSVKEEVWKTGATRGV